MRISSLFVCTGGIEEGDFTIKIKLLGKFHIKVDAS